MFASLRPSTVSVPRFLTRSPLSTGVYYARSCGASDFHSISQPNKLPSACDGHPNRPAGQNPPPAAAPRVLCRRSVSLAAPPFLFTTPSAASWRFQLTSSEIGPGTRSGDGSGSPSRLRSQPSRFLEASHPQALGASGLRRNAPQDRVTWHGRWN